MTMTYAEQHLDMGWHCTVLDNSAGHVIAPMYTPELCK